MASRAAVAALLVAGLLAALIGSGAAQAAGGDRPAGHRRVLLQRPMMNPPIYAADELERSISPQGRQPARAVPAAFATPQRGVVGNQVRKQSFTEVPNAGAADGGSSADVTPGRAGGPNFLWSGDGQQPGPQAAAANNWNAAPIRGGNPGGNGWRGGPQQPSGSWGGAGTGAGGQPGWGGGAGWRRNNKGDRQSLQQLTGGINAYPTISPQPITATGTAGTLSQGMRRRGNARSAAQSLAQTYSSGDADAAAQAVANAATVSSGDESNAVAEAVTETAINHPNIAPGLLARSAGFAVNRGQTSRYAETMADAFAIARQKKAVPQFTTAVSDAIATGGAPTRYAYGQAIATAIAEGGDSSAAVAEATATAFCAGGQTASSWASAYAVALSQDSRGCLVLNEAKAMAQARCGQGAADAFSKAEATSLVLGFCGLMDLIPGGVNMGWSSGNSGSSSGGGASGLPAYDFGGR